MAKTLKERKVWVGYSPKLGTVIYDPDLPALPYQQGKLQRLGNDGVVLWLVNPGRREVFDKATAREGLMALRRHLLEPPQSMTEEAATSSVIEIDGWYSHCRDEEDRDGQLDYADDVVDEEAEKGRELLNQDMSDDADDWARSDDEGWFYPD